MQTANALVSSSPVAPESLATRLRQVLSAKGISAHSLSVRAGLAGGHVGLILSGRIKGTPTADTLRSIADAAGVPLRWLAEGEGDSGLETAVPEESSGRPVFGNLTGWREAEVLARKLYPNIPSFAFVKARETSAQRPPRAVTPEFVVDVARLWMRHASDDELMAADETDADEQIAAMEAAADARIRGKKLSE